MTKDEIEFMLKNGFSIGEIMALQNNPEDDKNDDVKDEKKDDVKDDKKDDVKDDKKDDVNDDKDDNEETELVKTLKAELNKLREERQKMNRKNEIIKNLPEEKTQEQILSESIIKIYEDSQK